MSISVGQSTARPDRKAVRKSGRQKRHPEHKAAGAGFAYRPSEWLRISVLPILTILVCFSFVAACFGLVVGLLSGNPALVGFVFWLLPRLGFLALVVLLVRFLAATEPKLK